MGAALAPRSGHSGIPHPSALLGDLLAPSAEPAEGTAPGHHAGPPPEPHASVLAALSERWGGGWGGEGGGAGGGVGAEEGAAQPLARRPCAPLPAALAPSIPASLHPILLATGLSRYLPRVIGLGGMHSEVRGIFPTVSQNPQLPLSFCQPALTHLQLPRVAAGPAR